MTEMLSSLQASTLSTWVRESPSVWAYPTILMLHTVGLAVLVGLSAAVDLRLLGAGRRIPLAPLEKLFPAMWAGFWLNAATGALLFLGDPIALATRLFVVKMGLVATGVLLIVALRRAVYGGAAGSPIVVSRVAKTCAAASLAVWVIATAAGRMTAYW